MLKWMSRIIINCLSPCKQNESELIILEYGCETWLYTLISTLGLFFTGIALSAVNETIIIIVLFYLCQSTGGGYHAVSHMKCFVIMEAGLIFSLMFIKSPNISFLITYIYPFSIILLLTFPVSLSSTKHYLINKKRYLILQSRITTIIIALAILLMKLLQYTAFMKAACISIIIASVSRIYPIIKDALKKYHFKKY